MACQAYCLVFIVLHWARNYTTFALLPSAALKGNACVSCDTSDYNSRPLLGQHMYTERVYIYTLHLFILHVCICLPVGVLYYSVYTSIVYTHLATFLHFEMCAVCSDTCLTGFLCGRRCIPRSQVCDRISALFG